MTKDIGTTNWMAPEQMTSECYDEKVDVYAFGSILYEMIAHQMPFEDMTSLAAAKEIMDGHRPKLPHHDKRIKKLIKRCWKQDPSERPSMREIFEGFVKVKFYFDQTKIEGIEAIINFILKNDPDIKYTLEQCMKEARKPKDGSIILKSG